MNILTANILEIVKGAADISIATKQKVVQRCNYSCLCLSGSRTDSRLYVCPSVAIHLRSALDNLTIR